MGRRAVVIVLGAVVGCLAGLLGPLVFIAACVWDGRTSWSALTEPDLFPYLVTLAALGTVNGAVGAWHGWRSGAYRAGPVAWAPLLLLVFPAAECARHPSDSKAWGPALLATAIVAPFVWVAGRVGQRVGVAGRNWWAPPIVPPDGVTRSVDGGP